MTDGGAAFQAGAGGTPLTPFRPRSAYTGHEAFGDGDGGVLLEPQVARQLRLAAESATQEGRITGGLLYGRWFADEQGTYLIINGYLEAGPGENRGDQIARDGHDEFALSGPDLRLLRRDGRRMYTASFETGWWRSLPAAGEFGPADFESQRELVGPGGAGLLVFGSGVDWGTAYLGPDAVPPGPAEVVLPVIEPTAVIAPEPGPSLDAGLDRGAGPELYVPPATEPLAPAVPAVPAVPATAVATRRQPVLTPAPRPTEPRDVSPVRKPEREWGVKPPNPGYVGPETPTDVKIVVGLLILVVIIAAVMIGILVSDAIAAVIVGVVGLLVICGFLWMSRL